MSEEQEDYMAEISTGVGKMSRTDCDILEYQMLLSGTTGIEMAMKLFAANITRRYSKKCVRKKACNECGKGGINCPAKEDLNGIHRTIAATIAHIVENYWIPMTEQEILERYRDFTNRQEMAK